LISFKVGLVQQKNNHCSSDAMDYTTIIANLSLGSFSSNIRLETILPLKAAMDGTFIASVQPESAIAH
jgi:hypothetical protein